MLLPENVVSAPLDIEGREEERKHLWKRDSHAQVIRQQSYQTLVAMSLSDPRISPLWPILMNFVQKLWGVWSNKFNTLLSLMYDVSFCHFHPKSYISVRTCINIVVHSLLERGKKMAHNFVDKNDISGHSAPLYNSDPGRAFIVWNVQTRRLRKSDPPSTVAELSALHH